MDDRRPFYHGDMRALQDRFDGRRVADGLAKRTGVAGISGTRTAPPPVPEWKRRDYIREVLPEADPRGGKLDPRRVRAEPCPPTCRPTARQRLHRMRKKAAACLT